MKIREYKTNYCASLENEILMAGELLESLGYVFLKDFGTASAIDKASWALTENMEKNSKRGGFFGEYW
jgi:hypothetical protein